MKLMRIIWGFIITAFGVVLLINFLKDYGFAPLGYAINILIAFGFGIYFIFFKRKKDVVLENGNLVVKEGNKRIKEIDLTKKERIVYGLKSMKIVFRDFTEVFEFSKFNKKSVRKLKSLV